ncbi:MAG: PIN domain-containing protein [Deltaproteobacteria bacterium]|nr:PIN domain-containing protein [Deltaproteobacteria bacterium]MBW2339524.1 PIN domain-containing protein [Deltaproteobacteria bacterium]
MKANVLVDTSIWIEYFNKPDSRAGESLENLLREGRVFCAGVVLAELLQGAKIEREFKLILESMTALPFLETTLNTWIEAGRISFSLRKKGITIPVTDIILASLALESHCLVFTLDPHFNKIPGIKLYTED